MGRGNPRPVICLRHYTPIGSSTFPAMDILDAAMGSERRGLSRFRAEQQFYSILNRAIERDVLSTCQRFGIGVTAWSPLAKGMLTGKYRKDQQLPDTLRTNYFPKILSDEHSLDIVETLIPVAENAGMSLTHLALAFVIARPGIVPQLSGPKPPCSHLARPTASRRSPYDSKLGTWTEV